MEVGQQDIHREAARQLLEQARLSKAQLEVQVKQALSTAYWERLNPQLSVVPERIDADFNGPTDNQGQAELLRKLANEGYFQLEPLFSAALLERMRQAITVLRQADWPAVFAFVYAEFWQVARVPTLAQLLAATLGPRYRQLPYLWGHYVPPKGGTGWKPHIDSSHQANRLTVWIALSDASLTGSCMFLLPKNLAPKGLADGFNKLEIVSAGDVATLLKNNRPLPVQAGAVLGWEHNVIHWGGTAWQTTEPRISISLEFIREDSSPARDEHPILDPHSLPSFEQRLLVISKAIEAYQRFEPLQIRYLELAQRLLVEAAN